MSELPDKYFHLIPCPVCGGETFGDFISINYGDLMEKPSINYSSLDVTSDTRISVKECRGCGFVFVNPRVRPEFENLVYNESKENMYRSKDYLKDGVTEKFFIKGRANKLLYLNALLDTLRYFDPGKKLTLFDYGCGFGHVMSLARTLGINTYGVDIDRERLKFCTEQGFDVAAPADFDKHFPGVKGDIVFWQSNIEHVTDLPACLSYIACHCAPGAVLYVNGLTPTLIRQEQKTGVFDKAHFVEHINYFPIRTLDRFLGDHGFSPLGVMRTMIVQKPYDMYRYIANNLLTHPFWFKTRKGYFDRIYRFDG